MQFISIAKISIRSRLPWAFIQHGTSFAEFTKPLIIWLLCPLISQLFGMHSALRVCSLLNHVQLVATPWTVAHHAPLSMDFFRQEDWSGLPFPSPEDLPNPGIEPRAPEFQVGFFTIWANTLDLLKLFLNAMLSHPKGYVHHVEVVSPAFLSHHSSHRLGWWSRFWTLLSLHVSITVEIHCDITVPFLFCLHLPSWLLRAVTIFHLFSSMPSTVSRMEYAWVNL